MVDFCIHPVPNMVEFMLWERFPREVTTRRKGEQMKYFTIAPCVVCPETRRVQRKTDMVFCQAPSAEEALEVFCWALGDYAPDGWWVEERAPEGDELGEAGPLDVSNRLWTGGGWSVVCNRYDEEAGRRGWYS